MTEQYQWINKNITILGFNNVIIENINDFLDKFRRENIPIQFFDARFIAGYQHLYFAALNALNAFQEKTNISNNIAVEALLYASAQRQIKKAVEMLGIKKTTSELAVLILPQNNSEKTRSLELIKRIILRECNDKILELNNEKIIRIRKMFNISEMEFKAELKKEGLEKEALTDLVIEHMALLVTKS